ncbi:MAG: hypothetical protein DHS20C18_42600 [Saprospiraceae bacterium]|nr:MAG: hypothetical protein DHS20C18_42600 [Saprospiraceae bacterium]
MRIILIISTICCFSLVTLSAQPIGKSNYEILLQGAQEALTKKDYYLALTKYEEAYDEKKDRELTLTIAELHYLLRDYSKAERWYSRLLDRDKDNKFAEERFNYGRVLKMIGEYNEATLVLQQYIDETQDPIRKKLAQNELIGAEMALTLPETAKGVTVDNLGKKVNGKQSEYSPTLDRDGKTLYFSAFEADDVIVVDEKNTDFYARLYMSTKEDNGWSKRKALDDKINRPGVHTTNVALSADGKRMYFTRSILEGNTLANSKIYMSESGDGGWLGPNEIQGVNGEYIATHPAVGELYGKEVLFFSSNMEGGEGGMDLFYATYEGSGKYSDPVSLGAVINTVGDELTPYYHDGTLYFSSTGHPGIGGFDIFYSVWDGANWSEPKNMGKVYNTMVDDLYFRMDEEGYKGFLTSNREGGRSAHGKTCCDDIYSFEIAKLYADLVVGVFDDATKQPLFGATVSLVEMTNDTPGTPDSKTNSTANKFEYGLGLEKPYKVAVSHPDYFPDSMTLNTVGLTDSKTFQHNFILKAKPKPPPEPEYITIVEEKPIVLENILYDFDDDRIRQSAEVDLELVYEIMTEHDSMKVELGSHTDNRGKDNYNADLSQRRAESARRWLVRKGIDRERVVAKGYGETVPQTVTAKVAAKHDFLNEGDVLTIAFIDALETEEQKEIAHELNRRTEFKILEGPTSIQIKTTRLKKQEEGKEDATPKDSKSRRSRDRNSLPQAQVGKGDPVISQLSTLYGRKDLKGLPIMTFNERVINFGKVKRGEKRTHIYEFVNEGDTPLTISLISACDCTTTEYPTETIKPGGKGSIKVIFDSTEKEESETIDVDIMLENTLPETGAPIIEMLQYTYELVK